MKHEHVVQYSVAKDSDLRLKQHVHGDVSKVELEKVRTVHSVAWGQTDNNSYISGCRRPGNPITSRSPEGHQALELHGGSLRTLVSSHVVSSCVWFFLVLDRGIGLDSNPPLRVRTSARGDAAQQGSSVMIMI